MGGFFSPGERRCLMKGLFTNLCPYVIQRTIPPLTLGCAVVLMIKLLILTTYFILCTSNCQFRYGWLKDGFTVIPMQELKSMCLDVGFNPSSTNIDKGQKFDAYCFGVKA